MIYDPAGNEVVAPKVFKNAGTGSISATALSNRNFAIAYPDSGNSNYGTFVIYKEAHLALQKVSNTEVRLWNYTKETLEMILSVNQ